MNIQKPFDIEAAESVIAPTPESDDPMGDTPETETPESGSPSGEERLQKILARAGIASRRKAEDLIREGQVTINGRVAQVGDKATWGKDAIKVAGKLLHHVDAPMYLAFHKPKGVLSSFSDPSGWATLAEFLDKKIKTRLFPVGRLDFNSEGLLLLTNDGQFAEDLQKQGDILRVYHAKIKGHPTQEDIDNLAKGARVGARHQHVKPFSVRLARDLTSKSLIEVAFQGAGAVDVKAFFEAKGFLIEKLVRTAIGHLTLTGIPVGHYRILKESQVKALLKQPELGLRRLKAEEEHGPELREEDGTDERDTRLPVRRGGGYVRANREEGAGFKVTPLDQPVARSNEDRPSRRPSFGAGRRDDRRPRFGAKREHGAEGGGYESKRPRFGAKREFGSESGGFENKRPRFGAKREFGSEGGGSENKRPRFGAKRGFGDGGPRKFGAGPRDGKPGFGDKPRGFGNKRPGKGFARRDSEGGASAPRPFRGKRKPFSR